MNTDSQVIIATKCICNKPINSKNIKHFPVSTGGWFVEYQCRCNKKVTFINLTKNIMKKNPAIPKRVKKIAEKLQAL